MEIEIAQFRARERRLRRALPWLCVVAALVWVPLHAEAQDASGEVSATANGRPAERSNWKPMEFGARLGGSFSRFSDIAGLDQEQVSFLFPEAMIRWRIAGASGLQFGLSWVRKGATTLGVERTEFALDYLTLPILYRGAPRWLSPTPRVQAYGVIGPYVGLLVGKGDEVGDAEIASLDVGVTIGVGASVHVTPAWIAEVEVQYNQGFVPVFPGEMSTRNNRTLLLSVGFAFDLGGDYDRDGLLNRSSKEECWTSPEDWDGFEDDNGCADPDDDQDFLADGDDKQCPREPEDRDEYEDWDGCPDEDNDEDGILDHPAKDDQCPDEPYWSPFAKPGKDHLSTGRDGPMWTARKYGCPGTYKHFYLDEQGCRDRLNLETPLDQFGEKSAELTGKHKEILDEVATFLEHYPWIRLDVRGHTSKGEKSGFGQKRADAARDYLIAKGIDRTRLVAVNREDKDLFYQDYESPRAVAEPGKMSKQDGARIEELESSIQELIDEGALSSSSQLKSQQSEVAHLKKRRKQLEQERQAYQRYKKKQQTYDELSKSEDPKNSARNRRVTFGITGQ